MDSTFIRLATRGLRRAARHHGLRLVFYGCLSSELYERIGHSIPLSEIGYDSSRLAGTVSFFGGPHLIEQLVNQHRDGHPTAFVLRTGGEVPHVLPDDEPAIEGMIVRLHRHGHRRIAHLRGPADNPSAQSRLRGYQNGLAKVGLPFNPDLVFATGFSGEESYRAVVRAIDERMGITAIIAANDNVAFGALRAAKARGVVVPDQLEVVGYDNHFCAGLSEPALSTFEIPLEEMAFAAVAEIDAQIHGRSARRECLIAPGFVARSTTRFADREPRPMSPAAAPLDGSLPPPLPRLIKALPVDGPVEALLGSADLVIRESVRLDVDLHAVVHAIIDHTCGASAADSPLTTGRRELISAALGLSLNTSRLVQTQTAENAWAFNGITQRLRDSSLDLPLIIEVVREALGACGLHESLFHLRADAVTTPEMSAGTLYHWEHLTGRAEITRADLASVIDEALSMTARHASALILPLIVNDRVLGHIVADGHACFRPELERLGREIAGALQSLALHQALTHTHAHLRESEYFYASLVESLPQVILRKDADGRITFATAGFAAIVGRPLDQIIGRKDFEIVPADFARKLREEDLRVIRSGQPFADERSYVIDGQTKLLRVHKSPLRAPDGTVTGIQVIFWDVTSFRETEMRLRETQRELVEASRLAGIAEIATGILHNIGNALNSVNVSAGLITEKLGRMRIDSIARLEELFAGGSGAAAGLTDPEERTRKIVDFLRALGAHLRQSRSDILAEARALREGVEHVNQIVAAQQQFAQVAGVVEELDPGETADYALRLCEGELLRHGIVVVRDYQPAPRLVLERHKVIQILVNLIRNAKEAVSKVVGETRTIRVGVRDIGEGRVQMTVEDNGVGIEAEVLPLVFTMGFTTKKGGHGFGLHNSALTAAALGGVLRVESEGVGRGARFLLELPPCMPPGQQTS